MKFNRFALLALLVLLAGLLSGCSGQAAITNWPGMTSDGEKVYLADGAQVYTVRLADGTEISGADGKPIRFPLERDSSLVFYSAPSLTPDGKNIIVGNANPNGPHTIFAADPATGAKIWPYEGAKAAWMASPLVTADSIYAPNNDGNLYALDLNGQLRWKKIGAKHGLWSQPVTDGKAIYVASLDHVLYALDPQTGETIWQIEVDNAVLGHPAISEDGKLFLGTLSGNLYAINASDGQKLWQAALKGGIWSTPALSGSTLYVGTVQETKGTFYAIDAETGAIQREIPEASSIIGSPVVVNDQVIFVTEAGIVRALTESGAKDWATLTGKLYTTPLLVGDTLLFAPMQGDYYLAAYSLDGVQKWTFKPQ
jgi:outer membrane protein assembly factor BamB